MRHDMLLATISTLCMLRAADSFVCRYAQAPATIYPSTQGPLSINLNNDETDTTTSRRDALVICGTSSLGWLQSAQAAETVSAISIGENPMSIVIPMEYVPRLSSYVVRYTLGPDRTMVYTGIVDTGSPFLTVPSFCDQIVWDSPKQWGCYDRRVLDNVPFAAPTYERFDNNEGRVDWRTANSISFLNSTADATQLVLEDKQQLRERKLVFGVLDGSLLGGSGGVFLGLLRDVNKRIRPSFLGQTSVQSIVLDFRRKQLTLTENRSIIPEGSKIVPLVDLQRLYRVPIRHYTALASTVEVNGVPLTSTSARTYVIIDTGVTGMVVSLELWDERNRVARKNREKSLWGTVELSFLTNDGTAVSLTAEKPLTTPLGTSPPWPGFRGNLIVAGLAFLDQKRVSIEIENRRLSFT